MPAPLPSTPILSILERSQGAARLPALAQRTRLATAGAAMPVLRASRSPMQLSLPFFAPAGLMKGG